jgi:hypothetical protein
MKDLQPGGCWYMYYWDKRDAQPENVTCSFNAGDYHRP